MKNFIELTDDNGKVVIINVNQITSFSQHRGGTSIYLAGAIQNHLYVQEKYEEVKDMLFSIPGDK